MWVVYTRPNSWGWKFWGVHVMTRGGDVVAQRGSWDFTHLCRSPRLHHIQPLTSGYESLAKTWRRAVFPHCVSPTTTILQRCNPLLSMVPRVSLSSSLSSGHWAPRGSKVEETNWCGWCVVFLFLLKSRIKSSAPRFAVVSATCAAHCCALPLRWWHWWHLASRASMQAGFLLDVSK